MICPHCCGLAVISLIPGFPVVRRMFLNSRKKITSASGFIRVEWNKIMGLILLGMGAWLLISAANDLIRAHRTKSSMLEAPKIDSRPDHWENLHVG